MITSGHQLLVHEHLVLTKDTKVIPQSCQPDTERHSASSCHLCWDAVFCTYFVVIECVDWNKFVWMKALFLDNYLIFLICCIWAGQGCTLVKHETNAQHMCLLCLYIISIMFDVLADHRNKFTDSNVSGRVTSKPKHFIFCYIFLYCHYL